MTAGDRLVLRDRRIDSSTQQPGPVSDDGPGTQQVGPQYAPGPERPILSADRSPAAWIERFHLGSDQNKGKNDVFSNNRTKLNKNVFSFVLNSSVVVEITVKGRDERPSDALDSTLHISTMLSR